MKTLCYSVRLESLVRISEKAFKARSFDGSTAIIPASQVFGQDYGVKKSTAFWISAWILERKDIQYSKKKKALFDEKGKQVPLYTFETHKPEKLEPLSENYIEELLR